MKIGDRVAVVGASGYLGGKLCDVLEKAGYEVVRISRSREGKGWRKWGDGCLEGAVAVFNFAGKPIDCRWNEKIKKELWDSRIEPSEQIAKWIGEMPEDVRPEVVLTASGIGIFGDSGDETLDDDAAAGGCFVASLCVAWEAAAASVEEYGVRSVSMRFGAVMGRDSKPWKKMTLPYKLFLGGKLGDGSAYFAWIHEEDALAAMVHAMEDEGISGGVNFVAESCTHHELAKQMGRALGRPALFCMPAFAAKIVFGEFAEALLASINAKAKTLKDSGYSFEFEKIEEALPNLAGRG